MELLLLDTTEKEGEDNRLYHWSSQGNSGSRDGSSDSLSRWGELRGVYAAAMGTMETLVGEPLGTAHFLADDEASGNVNETIVAYVELHDVLYVMIFATSKNIPGNIAEYYANSSCRLLIGLLGFPGRKLEHWVNYLGGRLTTIVSGIFSQIERDLLWETHIQFAVGGCVPGLLYPIETLARMSAFEVIESTFGSNQVKSYAVFYKRLLVIAKMRPDPLDLVAQWLLDDSFQHESVTISLLNGTASVETFRWHDTQHALYGAYPDDETLVRIRQADLQLVYIIKHADPSSKETCRVQPEGMISTDDLEEFKTFTGTHLHRRFESSLLARQTQLHASLPPIYFAVVIDKVRRVVLGHQPRQLPHDRASSFQYNELQTMLDVLADVVNESFCGMEAALGRLDHVHHSTDADGATFRRWMPQVRLNTSDNNSLFYRPLRPEESDVDLSTGDAQIFPPVAHQLRKNAVELSSEVFDEIERHILPGGREICLIASYYEVYDLIAVCDPEVTRAQLDREMDEIILADS